MVDWFTAFNMMPSWLVQVNCLEIQILSEIVFSFSLPINVVIYNGRVAHLEGNLLPLTPVGHIHRNVQFTWNGRHLILFGISYFMCQICTKKQCAIMCKMVHLSRVQECRCGMSCHWNGRQSEDTYSPAFNDAYTYTVNHVHLQPCMQLCTHLQLHSVQCMAHHLHLQSCIQLFIHI